MIRSKATVTIKAICVGVIFTIIPQSEADAQNPISPTVNNLPNTIAGNNGFEQHDLLVEAINTDSGQIGVFALDILKPDAKPRLLSLGAIHPKLSANRRRLLYLKGQTMFVHDSSGQVEAWSNDSVNGRFANTSHFEKGKIWWDGSGKANFIDYWPSFGQRLNRSISLSDQAPLKKVDVRSWGFYDTIVPIDLNEEQALLSIGAASISASEDKLVAQVYPALPRGLGVGGSKLLIYELIYYLAKTDENKWMQKLGENRPNFLPGRVQPQIDGQGKDIGAPPEGAIDIEPLFSPSEKYISFNRVDVKSKAVSPCIVSVEAPNKVLPITIEILANESAFYPDQVAGWPSHSAVEWQEKEDGLWIVSGREEKVYLAREIAGKWEAKLVCGLTFNLGPLAHYAFLQNWFAGIYASAPERIYLVNAESGEKDIRFVDLPSGFTVRSLEW